MVKTENFILKSVIKVLSFILLYIFFINNLLWLCFISNPYIQEMLLKNCFRFGMEHPEAKLVQSYPELETRMFTRTD